MENKTQKITILGSVIASIVSSACCIGPVLFAVLGVSSAGLLSRMEPYRPLISIITMGLLLTAFYITYKKKPVGERENSKKALSNKDFISKIYFVRGMTCGP